MSGGNFSTITRARLGWRARFHVRNHVDGWGQMSFDLGGSHWRWTRRGIERAAIRTIRRRDAADDRRTAGYEFHSTRDPKETRE